MTTTSSRLARCSRSAVLAALTGVAVLAVSAGAAAPVAEARAHRAATTTTARLTNLAHLDWLTTQVDPPAQDGHTTYRIDEQPRIGVLWTYAEPDGSGGWRHVGGGRYDETTNTWGQGAYNADDISRAAVVYLRHWRATGSTSSRDKAYDLLRGLTYLQTGTGPNAGNVVLWMQPDGTLNPSAEPKELPDPSDSDASYWLARTIWALGEGYAAFRDEDPSFAAFLRDRLDLAVDAVDRQVLGRYGDYLDIDGQRTPAWLIADGADASAEAVLGLAAYVDAGGPASARSALSKLSEGVAALADGDASTWPYAAVRPWALSRSVWHGWGSQMPAALARASGVLGDGRLGSAAARDSFSFDPWLLTSGGPDNGRLPTRTDASQIAYGADSRLESLIATAETAGSAEQQRAASRLAGIVGGWFFGANPAGEPMYDAATGVTYDGISGSGTINRNSGAESTIHGLLAMLALDQHADVAELAKSSMHIDERIGTTTLEAEQAALDGGARAVQPSSLWTGESLFGGSGYAALPDRGRATFSLPAHEASLALPVFDREPDSSAVTTFRTDDERLGEVRSDDIGQQGDSPAPGALLPSTLPTAVPSDVDQLVTDTTAAGSDTAKLDAVMLEPLVSRIVLRGGGHGTALLSSRSDKTEHRTVDVAGTGTARVESYDGTGRLVSVTFSPAKQVPVAVPAGGFTFVRR